MQTKGSISRIKKLLFEEFVHNVSVSRCCSKNSCQRFLHEKTLILIQELWGLSFKDCKAYSLDIPRRLHIKIIYETLKIYHNLGDQDL